MDQRCYKVNEISLSNKPQDNSEIGTQLHFHHFFLYFSLFSYAKLYNMQVIMNLSELGTFIDVIEYATPR